jgi:hypothetical protein
MTTTTKAGPVVGLSQDDVVPLVGDPGCSYCKAARIVRAYMFVNPTKDCIICDACVVALAVKLAGIGDPDPYTPTGKPN